MNNKIIKYLLLASFIGTAGEQMITPLYSMFVSHVGGGILDAGIGFAIFSIITGLVITATGKIKWFNENTNLIVFLGFLISGIGDFSYFFVNNIISLFFVQALIGISVGLLNPSWEAMYTENMEDGEEHEAWSMWGGGANIATGAAALLGSGIAYYFGYKAMFLVAGVINLVAIYFAWRAYNTPKQKKAYDNPVIYINEDLGI